MFPDDLTPEDDLLKPREVAEIFGVRTTTIAIDARTWTTVGYPIRVGRYPIAVTTAPDGRRVYVANGAGVSISVLDTAKLKVVGEVDIAR